MIVVVHILTMIRWSLKVNFTRLLISSLLTIIHLRLLVISLRHFIPSLRLFIIPSRRRHSSLISILISLRQQPRFLSLRLLQSRNHSPLLRYLYSWRLNIHRSIYRSISLLRGRHLKRLRLVHIAILQIFRLSNLRSWRRPHRYKILKHIRMPGISEIVGKYSISLIFFGLAFEPVQTPVSPIYISFFQIFDQMVPRNIFLIVTKLPQKVRIPQPSHVGLRVEQSIFELLVTDKIPSRYGGRRPAPFVEMSSVD